MTYIRRYGFSRASRMILLILLPFLGITLLGVNMILQQGAAANPSAKPFLIAIFDLLISAALVGLISGGIGGFKGDDEPRMGKICALIHAFLVALMVVLVAILLRR